MVEDEPAIADAVAIALEHAGFGVRVVDRGEAALALDLAEVDLVLLDVMLPGLHGVEVCRRIRERAAVPVIMLTARSGEIDRVGGLRAGADDYVVKPFSMNELIERVHAQLRRRHSYDRVGQNIINVGDLSLDLIERTASIDGVAATVTETELRLLQLLASRPGQVFSRTELTRRLWREGFINDSRTCDTHIKNLRRKLEKDPQHPTRLMAVRGLGYLLNCGTEA